MEPAADQPMPVSQISLIRDSGPAASLGWLALAALSDRELLLSGARSTQYYETFFRGPWYLILVALLAAWLASATTPMSRSALRLRGTLIGALLFEVVGSAHLIGTPFAWLVAAVHGLAWVAALLLIVSTLRQNRSVLALETTVLFLFFGMLLVDFSFDWPHILNSADPQLLFRSFSNNVLHIGTWVHDILLPGAFLVLTSCVLIAAYRHRRPADVVRILLLSAAALIVFVSIEPNERKLAQLPHTHAEVPLLLSSINLSHVLSFVIITAALGLAPRRVLRRG